MIDSLTSGICKYLEVRWSKQPTDITGNAQH